MFGGIRGYILEYDSLKPDNIPHALYYNENIAGLDPASGTLKYQTFTDVPAVLLMNSFDTSNNENTREFTDYNFVIEPTDNIATVYHTIV